MDWALVLASQDIECAIEQRPEDHAWILVIASDSVPAADEAIRSFEKENATVWRHEIKWTGLLFDWRSIFWWAVIIGIHFLQATIRPDLRETGIMIRGAFLHGAWWRAFTAVTLHADVTHLALNAGTGFLLLGLAMGFYGAGKGMLLGFLAGGAANMAEALIRPELDRSLGASGMVMATLGLLAAQSVFERHQSPREWIGRGVLAAGLLLVLIGLDPKSDVVAHLLGGMFGFVFGLVLCLSGRRILMRPWLDVTAALLCAGLVIATWALAILHP